jgi:adenine-specific DNA-methyltransferase
MDVPAKIKNEGLATYAERLAGLYAEDHGMAKRKSRGQFFTPAQVARFMANMFDIKGSCIRLLDPGAGTGMLSAAFCERLAGQSNSCELTIDAYENDPKPLPFLKAVLESCKDTLRTKGINMAYNIHEQDFILHNEAYVNRNSLLWTGKEPILYDFVIANPPYYKLNKNSPHAAVMSDYVCGQPNIYTLFMAISANMLKPAGEMVFITPRSFCSGLYYKKFRQWFLANVELSHVHIFESRKEIFDKDEVLQENIILKAIRKKGQTHNGKIIISTSKNKHFETIKKLTVSDPNLILNKTEESFIKIPASPLDLTVLNVIDKWPFRLRDLGLEISTGPVVPFRAERYLLQEPTSNGKSVPLLWMHNMTGMKTVWPANRNKKPAAIKVAESSEQLLLPVKNYVLVRRFSSKEQPRRLHSSVFLVSDFPHESIGIENHLNYIHKPGKDLSVDEVYGLSAILNTAIVDNYFRTLNGNTQVNATDIRSLPFPAMKDVIKIGQVVRKKLDSEVDFDLDKTVGEILGIDETLIDVINKESDKYEQSKRSN